ncbi:hypothetical protein BU16DRAFT_544391 [Lophium mytilinum]|uniref:Uncharacterized protein n=1 Tax=Lophium mytilinum TaxID=390894 RepID=A0A6A6QCD7_9PEZI|nr:hypothetical protein BU16DRAFT_544391 [Lophium mytilinum]
MPIIYILYNADASIMGKLKYSYRKLKSSPDCEPACAACDITHGGLSLCETPAWVSAKKEIEASGAELKVVQWHRDEIVGPLKDWIKEEGIRYPSVVLAKDTGFEEVMGASELAGCKGDATVFVKGLRIKGVLAKGGESSL